MLLHRLSAVVLGILAFIAAFTVCAKWIVDAQTGMASAWIIVPFFWGAAILAVLVNYLAQWRSPVARYLARHRPLAGPREGVELPG